MRSLNVSSAFADSQPHAEYNARLAETILNDEATLDKLINESYEGKRTVLQTIADAIDKLLNAVKDAFSSKETKRLIETRKTIEDALKGLNEEETKEAKGEAASNLSTEAEIVGNRSLSVKELDREYEDVAYNNGKGRNKVFVWY